jgi:NitT/TauT family transport system substrate-binding protein
VVKVVLTTILVATWLLQSCSGEEPDVPSGGASASCAKPAPAAVKPSGTPSTVRVGVTGALAEAATYLADAQGYFTREGLRVQMINFAAPSRLMPALVAGQLDVGSTNVGPGLFNAAESGACVKVVGALTRHEANANGMFLVVRKDLVDGGSVRGLPDLRAMKIAVAGRDSSGEYALAKLLSAGGLTLGDAHMLQMSYPTILVSFANKSIDAAILPEAFATTAADKSLGVKWKPIADVLPGAQFGVVLFGPQFASQRDAAVHWMAAYLQAARDYDDAFFRNSRRQEVVASLIRSSPVKEARLYDEMSFAIIDPNGQLNLDSIADQMRWLVAAGELQQATDLAQVVDLSFAQAAVERLGVYQ